MPDETIIQLRLAIERLQEQMNRLVGDHESEKGNRRRLTKFMMEEIKRMNGHLEELKHLIDGTFEIRLDRLEQESERRKKQRNQITALWITVGGLILGKLYDFFFHK